MFFPSGVLIALAFVLLVSSVVPVWLVAAPDVSVPKAGGGRQKAFSFQYSGLFGKEISPKSPSLISSSISLEGTGSQGSPGSQAEGKGAGSLP